ncbi:uncharacterized protein LOC128219316 [Mya arenaria]|uniref:uncharacterized protein LOC128219316 n=1 Tax=Mya arenaria TaxID=6604 RepID=UPI0022E1E33A|nr:uncharacterized protein LOC128219316 [Mya arenaria]
MAAPLRPKQRQAIASAVVRDTLCVLPTGFGKTRIIENVPKDNNSVAIVINPLSCIIEQQLQSFSPNAVKLESLSKEEISHARDGLEHGNIRYILVHPEQAITSVFKKFLMDVSTVVNVSHIIVDEAHCILSWGASQFRPAFLKIGTLRVILPDAKILALTATATEEAQIFIMSNLSMSNVNIITESPDRRNVFLQVEERSPSTGGQNSAEDSVYAVLDKFLQKLKLKKQSFEKTIVYLPLKWCGLVHLRAKIVFDMKTRIVDELKKPDSSIRLLLATEACGMGVDIPDVRCIVHLTPPNNIETFIQQIGRCGRDGRRSESCVYFNKSDIASNKVNLSDHVRKYLSLDSCRRKYILNYFGHSDEVISEQNIDCCDNCSNCAKVY